MSSKLYICAIIPARGGSKGIPNKNIYPIKEKPLVAWTIEQAMLSKLIDDVFVSTDDQRIANVSEKYGAKIIKRPHKISGDKATSESALLHALHSIEKSFRKPDIIVFLQCTSLLRKKDDIDNAIKLFLNSKCDSLFSGSIIDDFLIWKKIKNKLKSINYDFRNRKRRQDSSPYYVENGSIYIFYPKVLEILGNRIGENAMLYEMDFWQAWQIDSFDDIPLIEYFINKYFLFLK